MRHAVLIGVLCLALALLGVVGTHAHLAAGAHGDEHAAHHSPHHSHTYAIAIIDAHHEAAHQDGGAIDIDPLVKAFGTVSLDAAFVAIATFCCFVELLVLGGFTRRLRVVRPLRPPRDGPRFPFLPPSQAPPMQLV